MRNMKFRAWDKTGNFMIYPETDLLATHYNDRGFEPDGMEVEMTLEGHAYISAHFQYESPAFLDNELTLLQFTGLTDKNGVEIYEGDIVQHGIFRRKIIFQLCGFWLERSNGSKMPLWCEPKEVEVIGNIYENPELLR
ncbi:hypothetical protein DOE78_19110 [Bacillus sp. Y1]|nr:YopX family protein [Bacillus sp. Y1]AYA77390.1 hypothetical protein DOE78_19110 [Bacillus sp. Y1]